MNRRLTAIVERESDGHGALCPEVDVASQGGGVAEARDNPEEALVLFFETAPAEEVRGRLRGKVQVTRIEAAVGQAARPVRTRSLQNSYFPRLRRGPTTRQPCRDAAC